MNNIFIDALNKYAYEQAFIFGRTRKSAFYPQFVGLCTRNNSVEKTEGNRLSYGNYSSRHNSIGHEFNFFLIFSILLHNFQDYNVHRELTHRQKP